MNAFLLDKIHRPALALLIARVFTGGLMCYLHGWSKLMAGTERWERLGSGLSHSLGMDFLSIPLGFMASFLNLLRNSNYCWMVYAPISFSPCFHHVGSGE